MQLRLEQGMAKLSKGQSDKIIFKIVSRDYFLQNDSLDCALFKIGGLVPTIAYFVFILAVFQCSI